MRRIRKRLGINFKNNLNMPGQTIKRHIGNAREQNAERQTCRAYLQPQSGGRLNRYDKSRSENRNNLRKMSGNLNKINTLAC